MGTNRKTALWLAALLACGAGTAGAQRGLDQVSQQTLPNAAVTVTQAPEQAAEPAPGSAAAGAALLRRAQVATTVAERDAAIGEAEQIYLRAVAADPRQGAALNNLAVLAVQKGDQANARQYFEQAIAADDGHKGLYALNYSKYLQETDRPAAIGAARVAVEAAPDSALAKEQLGALLWRERPADLLPFAREVAARGDTELATAFALQCLRSQSRPAEERRDWLILLAARAANEYALSATARETLAQELATLEGDPLVGRGAAQLRAAIEAPPDGTSDVSWWRDQSSASAQQPLSGRAAMRAVLLSAGEFQAARDWRRAEPYFKAAIDLGEQGPDPAAFLRLVELYASLPGDGSASREALAALMNQYQEPLFEEKGAAYIRGDWPLIYRMHTALGMTYAYLDVWRSNVRFQNGLFQLDHAMTAARNANEMPADRRPNSPLALPPAGVVQLARGYAAVGAANRGAQARVDGAAALHKIGRTADAKTVLATLTTTDVTLLDARARAQYEALRNALP
jgi:hypothetical protein